MKHVILIVLENKNASYVLSSAADPYIRNMLIPNYSVAENYYSISHPPLLNYVALISGTTLDIKNNSYPVNSLNNETLVDLLASHNISWKAYMESIPASSTTNCSKAFEDSEDPSNGPGSCTSTIPLSSSQR